MNSLPPPPTVQSVYPGHGVPPPAVVVGSATHVNPAYLGAPPSSVAPQSASVTVVSADFFLWEARWHFV
jgi:hypothetical protein